MIHIVKKAGVIYYSCLFIIIKYFFFIFLFFSCTKNIDNCSVKEKEFLKVKKQINSDLLYMFEQDQYIREVLGDCKNKHKKDSIFKIMDSIDNRNTLKLMEITKKYGFPNVTRIGKPIPAWVIFQHTPKFHSVDVEILIDKEYKCLRIPEMEYKMLKWHLNGRKSTPNINL